MSRYCADTDSSRILFAANHWRSVGLLADGSVLTSASLWNLGNLASIDRYFVNALTEEEGTFLEKLHNQMAPAESDAKQLLAEMVWVMLLCPANINPATKRKQIQTISEWSDSKLPESDWLKDDTLGGIGSAGQGFNQGRWRELIFFVKLLSTFKILPTDERKRLLTAPWQFAEWLSTVPEASTRQFRHMILYLLFPDTFERIFGYADRREIVLRLSNIPRVNVESMPVLELDRELEKIRESLHTKYGTQQIDFYHPPVAALWKSHKFEHHTKGIKREHVIKALRQIDEGGVPADAKSTTYDLIEGQRRYPPKLVLSFASKNATGEDFERSLFAGGEGAPAFALLRSLGFHIERKDFVSALLQQFLVQAEAADDLSTKSFPKTYRGLQVSVSFGKGNFGKIPWISFLGFRQKTSDGIYPVYLFYREQETLILAYGVSEP